LSVVINKKSSTKRSINCSNCVKRNIIIMEMSTHRIRTVQKWQLLSLQVSIKVAMTN
jgi:hypothetical protein